MASLPVRYLTNIFCRRRNRATVAVSCLIIVGVIATSSLKVWSDLNPEDERDWEAEFERAHLESLREHMSFYITGGAKLRPVPPQWTARDRCPACYGTDMCDAVDRQVLKCTILQTFQFLAVRRICIAKFGYCQEMLSASSSIVTYSGIPILCKRVDLK